MGSLARDGSSVRLRAQEMVWRKRSFGFLSVAFLRELRVAEGSIRIDLSSRPCRLSTAEEACGFDPAWNDAVRPVTRAGSFGNRVSIAPFLLDVVDGGASRFRIHAHTAEADGSGHLDLRGGVRVETFTGQELQARRAALLEGARLAVKGGYSLLADGARTEAEGDSVFRMAAIGALEPEAPRRPLASAAPPAPATP
jgi:hypothetical protein